MKHPDNSSPSSAGFAYSTRTLLISVLAWAAMFFQELALFSRATPLGGKYVEHWDRYFFHALLFNLIAIALISLPFWTHALFTEHRKKNLGGVSATLSPRQKLLTNVQRFSLALLLIAESLDHEVQRFVGTRLTFSLVATYQNVSAWGEDNIRAMMDDAGGPTLPFALLVLFAGAFIWTTGQLDRLFRAQFRLRWTSLGMCLLLIVPIAAYNSPGGNFRKRRVRPVPLELYFEWLHGNDLAEKPNNLEKLVTDFQTNWKTENGDSEWSFSDPQYPFWRHPIDSNTEQETSTSKAQRPNIVYLQVESLRAWDMGLYRSPHEEKGLLKPRPSATPFLDELAQAPSSAYWTRHMSFGPPTVGGFMAGHCSIRPHSLRNITTSFTYVNLLCFPELLRKHGYRAEFFTGTDPDWDHEGFWVRKWFDQVHFYRDANELDHELLKRTAERLRVLGSASQQHHTPFVTTIVTSSNHYPFRWREGYSEITQKIAGETKSQDRILNSVHYTDQSLRNFFKSLQNESWYANTIFIIVGDHAYNLGEHDGTPGQRNGYHESTWVPLIVHGQHPRIQAGAHHNVASLLDIAPTLLDLSGIQSSNPWLGHSLFENNSNRSTVVHNRRRTKFVEHPEFSLLVDPDTERPLAFDPGDPFQQHPLDPPPGGLVEQALQRMRDEQRLSDYLIENNRIMPDLP